MSQESSLRQVPYVLVTAAYNEQQYIEKTINSVVEQQLLPAKWVIVSDGSTDRTDDIVRNHAARYKFIEFVRREKDQSQGFASKVFALEAGLRLLNCVDYKFIGHLDADVSFANTYCSEILDKFENDSRLGIAGGFICEKHNGTFRPRRTNSLRSVPGAVQMFRRACYEGIGGFIPLVHGGEDWYAEVAARMNRWRVRSFPELPVFHHRSSGSTNGIVRYAFRQGFMDYSLGSHPVFEVVRLTRRVAAWPFLFAALARSAGYISACCRREPRMVSSQFVSFLRKEEISRLWPLGKFGSSVVAAEKLNDDLSS